MKITVYVPCHNNEATVGETLASLRQQERPADQFLFINDRCADESPDIARQHNFQVLQLVGSQGLAAGRNCALARARGDVILGVDADVVLAENYLRELENRFAAMPDIAAIGGRMDEHFTDAPADLWRAVHMPQHHGLDEMRDPRILFGATTACRVAVARAVGGWNERFVSHFEDVDFSGRIKAAGHHLLYAPDCQAWHLRRDTDDSILHAHWNWNYYGYEHTVRDLSFWLSTRLPFIWQRYRTFRAEDLQHPTLAPLTLRAPWSWIIRDLFILRKTVPAVGHVPKVVEIAATVLKRYGMNPQPLLKLVNWLNELCTTLEDTNPPSATLHPEIANRLLTIALESIPDGNYWGNMNR
jgi:GT2 family glycosyltransferase